MFERIFEKFSTFADHHQAIFALVVTISIIIFGWGLEKILEKTLFPSNPIYGYITAILLGLAMLWLTQHFILHVM